MYKPLFSFWIPKESNPYEEICVLDDITKLLFIFIYAIRALW